jgi:protein TonB
VVEMMGAAPPVAQLWGMRPWARYAALAAAVLFHAGVLLLLLPSAPKRPPVQRALIVKLALPPVPPVPPAPKLPPVPVQAVRMVLPLPYLPPAPVAHFAIPQQKLKQPAPAALAARAALSPSPAAAPPAPAPPAPAPPAPAPPPHPPAPPSRSWQAQLSAWLQAHKTYPQAARERRQEGAPTIRFTVARDGRVLAVSLVQSSGSPMLDAAATGLLQGAQLPAFPPEMSQQEVTVEVSIRYTMGR